MQKKWKKSLSVFLVLSMFAIPVTPSQVGQAATKPKLNKTKATVNVKKKVNLKVKNQIKGSAYTWKTSNKKVAMVTKKGVVKGIKAGKATITCKVKAPKKTYKLKCKVTVKKNTTTSAKATVSTQTQLNNALNEAKVTTITVDTQAAETFEIPAGNYSGKTLVINAPNADVVNSGVFETITIQAIKESTFRERAKGNKIYNRAKQARVIVEVGAEVEQINSVTAEANLIIEILGKVNTLNFTQKTDAKVTVGKGAEVEKISANAADSKLDLIANGEVKEVIAEKKTTLSISGTATKISVIVNGTGSILTSSVTIIVKVNANTEITLEKGAESSTIEKVKAASATVENKTEEKVEIKIEGGSTVSVQAGGKQTIEADTSSDTTPTAAPNTNGGGNSGSSSDTETTTVLVSKITLSKSTIQLVKDASEILTAAIEPENAANKTLEWSSSDEKVVTVDQEGKVTAVAASGSAVITVKATDASKTEATCAVIVYGSNEEAAIAEINALLEAEKSADITIELLKKAVSTATAENLASYQATLAKNKPIDTTKCADLINSVNDKIKEMINSNIDTANCKETAAVCSRSAVNGKVEIKLPTLSVSNNFVCLENNRIYTGLTSRAATAANDSFTYQYNKDVTDNSLGQGIHTPTSQDGEKYLVNIALIYIPDLNVNQGSSYEGMIPVLYSTAADNTGTADTSAKWTKQPTTQEEAINEWHMITQGTLEIEKVVIVYTVVSK